MANLEDRELEQYRSLLETPTEFENGFGWSTFAGIMFCGFIMLPGSIYLGLMTGGSMGAAGSWVTLILFAEIARRAMKTMNKQQLVVLLHAAGIMIAGVAIFPGGPFGHLVYRAYLVTSEAARDAGMTNYFPTWFVPSPDSAAITERTFFHRDWLMPIFLLAAMSLIGLVKRYTLGYFFFRLTSDVENLPFPMAPIQAQGAMAMAEMDKKDDTEEEADDENSDDTKPKKKKFSKWRLFSFGAVLGIIFGFLQVGVPAITGLFFDSPIYLIPQPWIDTTVLTEDVLPATPTGLILDAGVIFIGFVLPFWSVIGTVIAVLLTMILNPILHATGVLGHWQPGMDTINTTYANSIDFWMSFGIGSGLGLAIISIYSTLKDVRKKRKLILENQKNDERGDIWAVPDGRGDYPLWIALVGYILAAIAVIVMCCMMLPDWLSILPFLIIFSFIYNPLISYVNARLIGISGQSVEIPFIRESAFILSGAKGIDIWLAPIPVENYGGMAQSFRVNELTGVNMRSLLIADLVALPILFILSGVFWSFIWQADPIPSDAFPYAQVQWEYKTKQDVLHYSATFVAEGEDPDEKTLMDSEFGKALHPGTIAGGAGFTVVIFGVLSFFGLPTMLVYGLIRGLGNFPHFFILEIVGALIGRYYFQKKFGATNFLRMAPTLLAGYFTGVGLISMMTIAMKLIKSAVTSAPF